jgi:NitT/TauT family transport system ATP-binding protein
MAYLEIRSISKTFPPRDNKSSAFQALADISFSMERGDFYCLVGPSGCGKSTLLRIVDGLLQSDSGQVTIDGKVVMEPGFDRGMVFQQFHLLPWRSALANVEFGLEMRGLPRQERRKRAMRYIEMVGLQGFENHYIHQLSGGMQQRVGLARALAIEPEILLMDEPFGALDAQTREIMQNELMRIWSIEKRTAIFVTHDIEEALYLADRIVVMSNRPGRILQIVDVEFMRPRDENLRNQPEFAAARGKIWQLLKTER